MMKLNVCVMSFMLCACGSSIEDYCIIPAPPKSPQCEIEFVVVGRDDVTPEGPYEVLGHVVVIESKIEEPFTAARQSKVRPRACAMGGEAVALEAMGTGVLGTSSKIKYSVLRRRKNAAPSS